MGLLKNLILPVTIALSGCNSGVENQEKPAIVQTVETTEQKVLNALFNQYFAVHLDSDEWRRLEDSRIQGVKLPGVGTAMVTETRDLTTTYVSITLDQEGIRIAGTVKGGAGSDVEITYKNGGEVPSDDLAKMIVKRGLKVFSTSDKETNEGDVYQLEKVEPENPDMINF